MPLVPDLRYTSDAIAGDLQGELPRAAAAPESSGVLDTLAAAARQSTLSGAAYERFANGNPDLPDAPAGWDPLDHIQGYEDYAPDFVNVRTPSELAGRKSRIDTMRADRQVLARAGLGGSVAQIGMGLLDPSFLASIAVPELALAKGARTARVLQSAVEGAVAGGVYESGMQSLQDTRGANEALLTVGTGALLGGVLGSLGRSVPSTERQVLNDAVNNELARSEAGAAAVARPTTLEAESLARGGQMLSKVESKIPLVGTDLSKVMNSDSIVARQTLQDLADVPGIMAKNAQDVATPASVEAFTSRWDSKLADFSDTMKSLWSDYRERVPKDQRVSQNDFYVAIASSARRGDTHAIPEVAKGAQSLRSTIFDPLKQEAEKLGLMQDPVQRAQAASDEKVTGEYFKAQEAQLFADYQGRTKAAIREGRGTEGDAAALGEASGNTQTELERALETERNASEQTISDAQARVEAAQADHDQALSEAKRNLEDTFAAAKEEARQRADLETTNTATRGDQLELGIDILKSVREQSHSNATTMLEQAERAHQALSRQVRRDLPFDKARIEILKSRLQIAEVRRRVAKELNEVRKRFNDDVRKVRAMYADSTVPAAPVERVTSRALRDYKGVLREARKGLDGVRKAEAKLMRTERRRTRLQRRQIKKTAAQDIDKLEVARLKDFRKRAEAVSSRTATDADPAVNQLAKLMQDRTEGGLLGRVHRPVVDASRIKARGAESYFRRMYDREAIRANRAGWDKVLVSHFMNGGTATHAEATAAAEDVTRKILGGDIGQANYATAVSAPEAGPLKDRVLDIRDELIEPFLVNDPMKVATAYVKDLAPQVELTRRFGDREMKEALGKVSQDYEILRERARQSGDSKAITKLEKQEKESLEALVRVRDRILGRAGRMSPSAGEGARRAVAAARGWRNLVAAARLGGTAITGGAMDVFRVIAQYGFLPTMGKLTQLTTSPAFRALSKAQARRAGSAIEVALSRRVNAAYDGAITEGWTQKLANGLYKYTGLNHMTDFTRTLGASLLEDKVLKVATQVAEDGRPKQFDLTRLASLGLDQDALKRIHEQVQKHGGDVDGVRVSGSADWTDKALADIYDAAILKESKIVVQQPGAADRVWWMDSETGKLLGQLKSFSLSAPMRMLIAPVQLAGQGEYAQAARFVGYMMMGGYLTHALRQTAAGRAPITDPKKAAAEALTESGLMGVAPDILSPFARRLGLGDSVRYSDRNAVSAVGGPALGAFQDAWDVAMNRTAGGISASDLHAMRRLLPYNNAWYLRRAVNALEGETAEKLHLDGYDTADFTARLLRTEAPPDKRQMMAGVRP